MSGSQDTEKDQRGQWPEILTMLLAALLLPLIDKESFRMICLDTKCYEQASYSALSVESWALHLSHIQMESRQPLVTTLSCKARHPENKNFIPGSVRGEEGGEVEMNDTTVMPLPANLLSDDASPPWMNKDDNAWQLTAATLVGLQSVPGLVILYGSIVKKKWAVNSAFMALYAFAAVLLCWVGWGYRMSFGDGFVPFLGKPNISLDEKYLLEQTFNGVKFPNATMIYFQFVFAAITLILVAGALLGRMNFHAWMLFVPLWLTFSYTFVCYSIWCPDGWLSKMGIIDFAGGFVIHLSSGVAGFTAAFWVGPRATKDRERFPPNNILLMLAGAGLLWMGWSGFNGGAPYTASTDAALAILNTHICTATSLLTWLLLDIIFFGKPSVIGATQGMITGLVCITPAAGVVQGWAAIVMGIMSGCIPWCTMMVLHKKIWLLKQVDDTMAVFHTHAIAGSLGGILAGFFAEPKLSRFFYQVPDWEHYVGLAYGIKEGRFGDGMKQMGVQLLGILFVVIMNVTITSVICLLVRFVVPLRLADDELQLGDDAIHGEEAYALWGDGEKFETSKYNSIHGVEEFPSGMPKRGGELEMA